MRPKPDLIDSQERPPDRTQNDGQHRARPAGRVRRVRMSYAAFLVLALLGACGQDELTANSTCREYFDRPGDERADAAIRISTQVEGVSSPGNPLWARNLDASCGAPPSSTLREAFGGGRVMDDSAEGQDQGRNDQPAPPPAVPADGFLSGETLLAYKDAMGEKINLILSGQRSLSSRMRRCRRETSVPRR